MHSAGRGAHGHSLNPAVSSTRPRPCQSHGKPAGVGPSSSSPSPRPGLWLPVGLCVHCCAAGPGPGKPSGDRASGGGCGRLGVLGMRQGQGDPVGRGRTQPPPCPARRDERFGPVLGTQRTDPRSQSVPERSIGFATAIAPKRVTGGVYQECQDPGPSKSESFWLPFPIWPEHARLLPVKPSYTGYQQLQSAEISPVFDVFVFFGTAAKSEVFRSMFLCRFWLPDLTMPPLRPWTAQGGWGLEPGSRGAFRPF